MHWTLALGLLGILGPGQAFGVKAPEPAPSMTLRTTSDDVICSLRVWVASPNVDRDMAKTAPSVVDPGMVRPSGCRPTEVLRMSPSEPSHPPTR